MDPRQSAIALTIGAFFVLSWQASAHSEGTTLRVVKKLVPPGDPGLFNLNIDAVARATNVGNGGTTGPRNVVPGNHTVSENAGLNTNPAKYSASFGGDCDANGHVVLALGGHKICLITNTRLGTLKVFKKLVPPSATGKFNLTIDGHIYADNVGNGGTTGQVPVQTGIHAVGETAGTATNLFLYVPTYGGDCNATGHVVVPAGVNKICIITNTRRAWTTKAPGPLPAEQFAVGSIGQKIYVAGGQASSPTFLNRLVVYDTATNTWATKTPMPTQRSAPAAGVINGILYVVGGRVVNPLAPDYTFVGTVEAYDPVTDSWTTKTPMPTGRSNLAVAVLNGRLYAIGGNAATWGPALNTVEAYNPSTDSWTTRAPLPIAQTQHGAAALNNKIYSVGGLTASNSGGLLAILQEYSPGTNSWVGKTPMSTGRSTLAVGVAHGVLYAVGGYDNGCCGWFTSEGYNPATDSWFTSIPMPIGRLFLGPSLGVVNDTLYAIEGRQPPNGNDLKTMQSYGP